MKSNPWFAAEYAPRDRSELTPEAEEWIGWQGVWEVTHLLTETDGPDIGMPLCTVSRKLRAEGEAHPPVEAFLWVPISDLKSIHWSDETLAEVSEELAAVASERYGKRSPSPSPSQ